MLSWKEKVAEKLSRLLADSPSSPSSPHVAGSPVAPPESQEKPFSSEEFNSTKKSSFSSYYLPFLVASNSGDGDHNVGSPSLSQDRTQFPLQSLHERWQTSNLTWKYRPPGCREECGTESESDDSIDISSENRNHDCNRRNVNGSNGWEEPSTSHTSDDFHHYLTEKSTFMSGELFEFFQSSLPNIVKGCQWVLLYSTWKHGISLRTLLRKSLALQGPCLLIVGDVQGAVFGGLLDAPLKPMAKRKYQGTNQTFVFTTLYGEPRLFRATGANRYYYLCLNDVLAFGGGGSFALCLDEDLLNGSSGPCETFGNLCLAHSPEFELKNVELWGFTHLPRHLT
ncbi:oxidation resistance protein 1 [Ananas comosus]|uniref:Oxidation resistance protein 1 n=1 Tax=Ananas comosus TaxID=4615 RepID=A0A6P5FCK2_ANACO|nr:oxidation resistance protein 1 [Ananas comosus]